MAKPTLKKRSGGLGKGLGALLADAGDEKKPTEEVKEILNSINDIPIEAIETNPFQPRSEFNEEALEELSESIKLQGIIQPITVRSLGGDQFQLISGERRFRASQKAGLTTIPAYIRVANDQQMLELAIIENIQRENLNAIEVALSYQRLLSECSLKQEELGERVGKKRSTVTNYLRLLKLPPDIQAGIRDAEVSMGHARALISLESADQQLSIYHQITAKGLSVRATEELVRQYQNPQKKAVKPVPSDDYEAKKVQTDLASHFGTQVRINRNEKGKGEIKIPFQDADDLNRILDLIKEYN